MRKSGPQNFFGFLAVLAFLTACSGMSPGGGSGAPGEVGGGGSLDGGSLGGGSGVGGGGGPLPGGPIGGTGGGEAQPSTQQSGDAIGAPCIVNFQVAVKITRNGVPEACSNAVARAKLDDFTADDGEMAPPDLPPTGPTVTLKFLFTADDNPFNVTQTHNTQCVEGKWETVDNFFIRYPGKALDCSGFHQVSAQANLLKNGQNFSSNIFQGPPVPAPDDNFVTHLEVTMDLGTSTPTTHGDTNTGSTVLSF